jgi:hypothetical protein
MSVSVETYKLPPSIARSEEDQYCNHVAMKRSMGDTSCDMCRLTAGDWTPDDRIDELALDLSAEYPDVAIIPNSFPYDAYDGQEIRKHHLLVPLGHVASVQLLHTDVRAQFFELMVRSSEIYDLSMTRTPQNPTTSIPGHLHTHLMVGGSRITKFDYDQTENRRVVMFEGKS